MKLSALTAKLRVFAMTLFGFLVSSTLLLTFLPLLLVLVALSRFVFFLIRLKLGNKFARPGGLDILQGLESDKSNPYIHATARYKGVIGEELVKSTLLRLIFQEKKEDGEPRFRRFTQIFQKFYGYHIFKDDENFDVSNHVVVVPIEELFPERYSKNFSNNESETAEHLNGTADSSIKQPNGVADVHGNGFNAVKLSDINSNSSSHTSTEEDVESDIGWEEVMHRMLDKYGASPAAEGHPQWTVIIVNEKNHTTLDFKINHGFSDGIYFLRFFLEYVGDNPIECFLPYNYHQPSIVKRILDAFWAFCLLPFGISRLWFPYENNPLHGPELSGEKMYLLSKPFDLHVLKEIKRESKVSVNAVMFSCLSHAVATHFHKKKSTVPHIIALVPVSLQDLERPVTLKNRFGLKGILIPTFLEKSSSSSGNMVRNPSSPIDRLRVVQKWIHLTQSDPSFLAIHWMLVWICSLVPTWVLETMWKSKGLTTTISNIAGPQHEDHIFGGFRKVDFAFWIPDRSPLGMGISIGGYKGKIRIGLMIDRVLINNQKEGNELLEAFIDEVNTLQKAVRSMKAGLTSDSEEFTSLMIKQNP